MQKNNMIEAFIFDVFGTLVDWRSGVAREADAAFKAKSIDVDPFEFASQWRKRYHPAMQRIRSGERSYAQLDVLHLENLEETLAAYSLGDAFSPQEKQALNRAWEKLPPWADTVAGLTALKKQAIIAPCSNGSIGMMARLAKFGCLPWDAIVGADIARMYKPQREVYLASAAALRIAPENVMMVAAHNSDLEAAREAGLMTTFFPRPDEHGPGQTKDLEASGPWDIICADVVELADRAGRI